MISDPPSPAQVRAAAEVFAKAAYAGSRIPWESQPREVHELFIQRALDTAYQALVAASKEA